MNLWDKTNPKASLASVLRTAVIGTIVGTAIFFLCFKPMYRDAWPITLPIWILVCATVYALCEWQVNPDLEQDEPQEPSESQGGCGSRSVTAAIPSENISPQPKRGGIAHLP